MQVRDREGQSVALASLWADGPALVVFLRHFGCMGCALQVEALAPRLYELQQVGVRVAFIGNGEPQFIAGFETRFHLHDKDVALLSDPERRAYQAVSFARDWSGVFGPKALFEYLRGFGNGHTTGVLQGDLLQQGGVVLIDRGGRVVFTHANRTIGDLADPSTLVQHALVLAARRLEESP